jgi:hypothetical protein
MAEGIIKDSKTGAINESQTKAPGKISKKRQIIFFILIRF